MVHLNLGFSLLVSFSELEINKLAINNIPFEIQIPDVQSFYAEHFLDEIPENTNCDVTNPYTFDPEVPSGYNNGSMAGFLTYQEMLNELDEMQAQFPNLISVKDSIGNFLTHENRPIYWVRISDNPAVDETDEKEVLYSAVHHAREPMSMMQTIFFMWYLLENYAGSEEIQHLVNNGELYFIPCLNPDGYLYNESTNPTGGGMHRKNRRNVGTNNKGVDLNRNYSYQWGTTGISQDVNSDVYMGTAAFSEPETQAMKWFCEQREFETALNSHSYGDLMLFPVGATSNEFADDHDYFLSYTDHMVQFSNYTNQKSSALYPASGGSDDYMYLEDLFQKPRILALTPEVGTQNEGFWPPLASIEVNAKNMVFHNLINAHLPHRYMAVKDIDPFHIGTSQTFFSHEVHRLGLEDGSVTVSIEPLENIVSVGPDETYNIAKDEVQSGFISFNLNPGIQGGQSVKYVLKTVYENWTLPRYNC